MEPPPPPPQYSHSSSTSSFPILAISILGILATAILLLSYYLFVINCCLSWRLRRSPSLLLRPRLPDPAPPRPAAPGLADSAIRSIPTLRHGARAGPSPVECAVCLAEFRQQELLRVLPGCAHSFHIDCIDTWLQSTPNCPLCRFDISRLPFPFPAAAVVEVAADGATPTRSATSSKRMKKMKKPPRNFWQAASMGDECIDIGRDEDESFAVAQPMRRSFSMDSSHDRALFRSVQEALQRNGELVREGGNACGRIRRSLFSFGRSSRSAAAVLPVQSEEPV